MRDRGIEAFRNVLARTAPDFADRVTELRDWDDIELLTVVIDRLREWCRPGLLCIGDSAHGMLPIGGVGINLAIHDAVAAANGLARNLIRGSPALNELRQVQKRREWPARVIQQMQILIQDLVMTRILQLQHEPKPPLALKLLDPVPFLRRIPARLIGMGVRPEHVRIEPA